MPHFAPEYNLQYQDPRPRRRVRRGAGRGPGLDASTLRSARTARGGTSTSRGQARELLAREVGAVRKPHGGRLRVALAFPNTYFVGMSNLGLQTVYRLFNADERVVCERVFLPAKQELAALARAARAARHDRVADARSRLRRLRVLGLVRVGLHQRRHDAAAGRAASRAPTDAHARDPLVVIGGAVTFVNPEPLAPFADVIAAGEAELLVPALVDAWFDAARTATICSRGSPPTRGFYVPRFYDVTYDGPGRVAAHHAASRASDAPPVVRKAAVKATDRLDPPSTDDLHARHRVRIAPADRGRPRLRQSVPLLLGRLQLPARPAVSRPTRILEIAEAARPHAKRVGLVSIALCDHPDIEHDPRAARRDGLRHQPGLAAARRPDRADRRAAARRAASGRSRSRPRPDPTACAASSTRPSRTTRSSTAPS